MARYLFKTHGGIGSDAKAAAIECGTLEEARIEALVFMSEMLRDDPDKFWRHEGAAVTVADGAGLVLFRLELTSIRGSGLLR